MPRPWDVTLVPLVRLVRAPGGSGVTDHMRREVRARSVFNVVAAMSRLSAGTCAAADANHRSEPTKRSVSRRRTYMMGNADASDRASSEYFGMPSAAIGRDDAVDHIAAVHEIPLLLSTLCPVATRDDEAAVDR